MYGPCTNLLDMINSNYDFEWAFLIIVWIQVQITVSDLFESQDHFACAKLRPIFE